MLHQFPVGVATHRAEVTIYTQMHTTTVRAKTATEATSASTAIAKATSADTVATNITGIGIGDMVVNNATKLI